MGKNRHAWLTEWKNYRPEMFKLDELPKRETWYAVSWKEVFKDARGVLTKRYHQYNFWTQEGAERLRKSLMIRMQEGSVDHVKVTALQFEASQLPPS